MPADKNSHGLPSFLDPDVVSRTARLELRARRVVEGMISGLHRSPYHGYSIEFAQHREYLPGDDIKHIDWKVWARSNRFYLKQYEEETNLRCTIMLDCSRSMAYGEAGEGTSKFDFASLLTAVLGILLQQHQDAVGAVLFDTDVRTVLPPSNVRGQLDRLFTALAECEPDHRSDVDEVFGKLPGLVQRRGVIALISDLFLEDEALAKLLRSLAARRHDVIVFHLLHEDEIKFPFTDPTQYQDLESDDEIMADPLALRAAYLEEVDKFRTSTGRLCGGLGIDYVPLHTGEHMDAVLARYLLERQHGRKGGGTR